MTSRNRKKAGEDAHSSITTSQGNDVSEDSSPPSKKVPKKRAKPNSKTNNKESLDSDQPQQNDEVMETNAERRGDLELEEPMSDEEGGLRIGDIYIPPPPKTVSGIDVNGPRLIITQIENEFFKSYAGKTVLGPFHKCFTSIVGPNGSGKSNVIDSMLFVFGYRASKIRSKKISVLLHNSDQHRNVQSCTVAVHFKLIIDKEGDDYEVVPGSELVIARTAFRDSSSFYTINGKRAQFKEVAKLLRSHGIDLDHNRFLILQGEVEQIALMKPKGQNEHDTGMLEFLEDIIGTTRFKEPIEKLSALVENLNEDRAEKLNRVKMVEKEKDSLEGPKDEALKALQQENQYSLVMNLHCQKYIRNLELDILRNEEKRRKIDEGMTELKKELQQVETVIGGKEEVFKKYTKQLEKMNVQKTELNEQFNKINNRDIQVAADIQQTNKKRKKTMESLEEEKKKLAELENIPEKNTAEIKELKTLEPKLVAQRETEQKEVEKVMASIAAEANVLTEKRGKLENELVGLTAAANEHRSKLDIAKKELDIYLHNENTAKKRLEDLKATYESSNEKISTNKTTVTDLRKKIPRMEKELNNMKREFSQTTTDEAAISLKLREQRASVEEARSDQAATTSRNSCLNFLMDLKRKGALPGIIGRLGDLGGIDEKYDVAVSTACPMLDYILVDSVDTGQMAIDHLKRGNVGRANFIILEKQEHLRHKANTPMNTPENVPRLFDLVRIRDDKVKTAFYFALRDTLVADSLDQATRIGYGAVRHRVVTLNGELIEPSGTMTGGGRQKISGRMGRDSRRDVGKSDGEIAAMEEQLERLRNRAEELSSKINNLNTKIRLHTQEMETDKGLLEMAELEMQALTDQLPQMEAQLKLQKEKVKECVADPKQVKAYEANIASIQKDVDKSEEAEGKVKNKVKEMTNEIEKLTSGRVRNAQKKLDDVNKRLDKVQSEVTRLSVQIKTSQRNAKKTADKIASMTQEIEDVKEQLVKMVADKDGLVEEADKVCKMLEAVTAGIIEKDDEIKAMKNDLEKIRETEKKLKSSKMDEDQKIHAVEEHIKDKRTAIVFTKSKLNKLTLHSIPGAEKQDKFEVKSPEELDALDADNLQYEVSRLEGLITKNKPNLGVIEEYNRKEAQYLAKVAELEGITNRRNEVRAHYDEARKKRFTEFMAGFSTITEKLKEMYQMITLGGDAELELCDTLDPFAEGIVFSVRPPKKSWKSISNLSGGEKTLSSLALVFALHYYKPTPLYVMDEIDAALDFKNVSIVANYIKERTKNAQFIIISLRSNMFELADTLVGIYKTYNCTHTSTINPKFYENLPPGPFKQQQDQKQCTDNNKQSSKAVLDNERMNPKEPLQTIQTTQDNPPTAPLSPILAPTRDEQMELS